MMQSRSLFNLKTTLSSAKFPYRLHDTGFSRVALACVQNEALQGFRAALYLTKMYSMPNYANFDGFRSYCVVGAAEHGSSIDDDYQEELSDTDEEEELCPVDCVREFNTESEFLKILDKAKETNSLVVVDFYRTSCGSCKYIEQGFAKLCKKSGDQEDPVIFLKHNVIDEYDEQSEVAERLRIKTVPLFHFYKNGVLLEAFPTRDKARILSAILKYTRSTALEASPS